jgi:hypothetical protein
LNLEAKNYADIAFHQIIDGACKQLDVWIDQTEEPADEHDFSVTIFKITRKGSWAAFKAVNLEHLDMTGLSYVTYRKAFSTDQACDYIVVDYERFFTQNKAAIRRLGGAEN